MALGIVLAKLKPNEGFSCSRRMNNRRLSTFVKHLLCSFICFLIMREKRYAHRNLPPLHNLMLFLSVDTVIITRFGAKSIGYSCKVRTCYKILYPRVTKRANMLYAKTISFYSGPRFATNTNPFILYNHLRNHMRTRVDRNKRLLAPSSKCFLTSGLPPIRLMI